jgi:hypothetical protein
MGCLLKTLEKGFVRLEKDQKKEKNNKTKGNNKRKIEDEKNNKNSEKEIDIIKQESSNTIINKSIIKNKDNYFKKEQLDYYMNVYLLNHTQEEPKEKLNYKR